MEERHQEKARSLFSVNIPRVRYILLDSQAKSAIVLVESRVVQPAFVTTATQAEVCTCNAWCCYRRQINSDVQISSSSGNDVRQDNA